MPLTSDHTCQSLGLTQEVTVQTGLAESTVWFRSDSRIEVFMPPEQIPSTGHCCSTMHSLHLGLGNPDSGPEMSFWLRKKAVTDHYIVHL